MQRIFRLLIFLLVSATTCSAFDLLRGIPNGLGGSLALSKQSLFSVTQIVPAVSANNEGIVALGANRKFDLKELDQYALGGAIRYQHLYTGILLSSFGQSDLYAERGGQLLFAYQNNQIAIGGTVSGMLLEFGGPFENLSTFTFGLTASWQSKYLLASITADNLNNPKPDEGSAVYQRYISLYGEFRKSEKFSLTGRAYFENDKQQFGFGQRLQVSSYGELLLGVSTDPFQYGGGVNLFWKQFTIVYAVSYHPDLGLSHTVSLLTHFQIK